MRTVGQARADIAGVVGRWQVDDLHEAHRSILDEILKHHKKVVVFIGVSENLGSKENPLDYPTRAAMIQEHYPNVICLPIQDKTLDAEWSKDLDRAIRTVCPVGSVLLYGGRDSFVRRYSGGFGTVELDALVHASGTEIREAVGREVIPSADFRAGVIYASANRYNRLFMVVDIAIVKDQQILLGNKTGNRDDWGLPGGFVDANDKSLEHAARREAYEETGILPETLEYVGSFTIADRRMGSTDTMLSACYIGRPVQAAGAIRDPEFAELKWFPITTVMDALMGDDEDNFLYKNHQAMLLTVCEREIG